MQLLEFNLKAKKPKVVRNDNIKYGMYLDDWATAADIKALYEQLDKIKLQQAEQVMKFANYYAKTYAG